MVEAEAFGAALRAAREEAGMSLKAAAARIGISHNALGGWELGRRKRRMARQRVEQLEAVYGIADRRLLRIGGYSLPVPAVTPGDGRRSLSYGGDVLTGEEEQQVRLYIDFLRSRR